ncbi:hypothetical protein THICB6_50010 [Thiomonas arsenitoxydans]|nr:hypothetical protein THICB6_50010 [Thiomonas arsenitoxydans]
MFYKDLYRAVPIPLVKGDGPHNPKVTGSNLPVDPPRKLFAMGFVTNLLNPKIAVLYLSCICRSCRSSSTLRMAPCSASRWRWA